MEVALDGLGESYVVRVAVYHTLEEKRRVELRKNCDICTVSEACSAVAGAVAQALERLGGRASKPTPRAPANAEGAGERRHSRKAAPRVTLTQRQQAHRPSPPDERRKGKVLRGVAWVAGGAALLGLIPGAVLLSLDGRGTCSGGGECPKVYDTKTGGIVALSLGGACLATAATLYVLGVLSDRAAGREEAKARSRREGRFWGVTVVPSARGVTAGVVGEF
jgi:hypothetical protein